MNKVVCLLSLAALSVRPPAFAIDPPAAPPAVDQRRQTSERFGFVVHDGGDLSQGAKAWKVARFVRLFYIGYALSESAPNDVRAEVFRRSLGNNNASWNALWEAAKGMAKQAAGAGDGTVDLLFASIAGLEDPEKQYDRMMRDPDFMPCSDIVLRGLLGQLDSADSAAPSYDGTSSDATDAAGGCDSPSYGDTAATGATETYDGRPSDAELEDRQAAMDYLQSLLAAKLRGEVDMEHWLSETKRTERILDRINGVTPEQKRARAANAERRTQQLGKTVTCRDCRGTGWGPPIRGTLAPKFAGSFEEVRLEYCKGCGGVATTDHRHNPCNACHGLGKRRPFLGEIDAE